MRFVSEMENFVEDLDAFFAKQGAKKGHQLNRFGGQDKVEILVLGRWPSDAKFGKYRSHQFKAMDWAYAGDDTFQNSELKGSFLHKPDNNDDFNSACRDVATNEGNALFKMTGYLSTDGSQFAAQSVTFLDIETDAMFATREIELCAPTSFKALRFGELTYDAGSSTYSNQFKHGDRMVDLAFHNTAPAAIESQVAKMAVLFDAMDSLRSHTDLQKQTQGGELLLSRVSLDESMFFATFTVPNNHDVEFLHVATFYESGELVRTDVDVERASW